MNKKIILAIVLLLASVFFFIGTVFMAFDLRPLGIAVGLLFTSIVWGICGLQKRKSNLLIILGNLLCFVALVAVFATLDFLPDFRPLVTSITALLIGLVLMSLGFRRTVSEGKETGSAFIKILGMVTVIVLLGVSGVLYPQINWELPGNPAAVMILSALTALGVLLGVIFNHPRKVPIIVAGLISIANFIMIPFYEKGVLDFLGDLYRQLEPFYAHYDPWALTIELSLVAVTVVLSAILIIRRKARVSNYSGVTLFYLLLQPALAILLFEMMGNVAGESTTRAELLVTNSMAVMVTFGMVFIAVFFYILFQFLPFWIPSILAGLWWLLWKVWFLHHPPPATFIANLPEFAAFLFLSAMKRIALPMVIIILLTQLFQAKKTHLES